MLEVLSSPDLAAAIGNVVVSVVGILATVLAGAVIGFVRSKLNASQLEILGEIARTAVMAAEQSKLAGIIEDKKEFALEAATDLLASRGITVDAAALSHAIESAVAEELNRSAISAASYAKAEAIGGFGATID